MDIVQPKKRGRGRPPGDFTLSLPEKTQFEVVTAKLRLDHKTECDELAKSAELRAWAEKNSRTRYIPQPLIETWDLREWGIDQRAKEDY